MLIRAFERLAKEATLRCDSLLASRTPDRKSLPTSLNDYARQGPAF